MPVCLYMYLKSMPLIGTCSVKEIMLLKVQTIVTYWEANINKKCSIKIMSVTVVSHKMCCTFYIRYMKTNELSDHNMVNIQFGFIKFNN